MNLDVTFEETKQEMDADFGEIQVVGAPGGDIPSALPNPYKLIFTGAANAEYDGSKEVEVNIPAGGGNSDSKPSRLINSVTLEAGVSAVKFTTDSDGNPFDVKRLVFEHIPKGNATAALHCSMYINGASVINRMSVIGSMGSSYYKSANNGTKTVIIDMLSGEVWTNNHTNTGENTASGLSRISNSQKIHDYLIARKSITSIELVSNNGTPFNEGDVIKIYGR